MLIVYYGLINHKLVEVVRSWKSLWVINLR